jgi:membrane protein DedA with SNARE-associated domain
MKLSYIIEELRLKYGIYIEPTFIAIKNMFFNNMLNSILWIIFVLSSGWYVYYTMQLNSEKQLIFGKILVGVVVLIVLINQIKRQNEKK